MRILNKDIVNKVGGEVELAGWISNRRDHGKLIFIDLRDRSGISQVVFLPNDKELHEMASKLRTEWVIKVIGEVVARPENMINPEIETGKFEIQAEKLEIINEAETLPISIDTSGYETSEDVRMKYRYVDLRRERLQKNIRMRAKVEKYIRDFLTSEDFVEIETPILTKSTPEGARDYLVPSRLEPGNFYALPQSPQQYKQLLMVAGFERYFQLPRCFRDEDTRGDRQPEFTQMDLEMSFVGCEDVMALNEKLLISLIKKLYPNKELKLDKNNRIPRISYKEAMEKYKIDRPDLRTDEEKKDPNLLAFCWVVDFPFFEKTDSSNSNKISDKSYSFELSPSKLGEANFKYKSGWTFTHNPFSALKGDRDKNFELLQDRVEIDKILTDQYDIVLNGCEIGGGSIRNHDAILLKKVFEVLGYNVNEVENNFGHMMKAFNYGAPPHGGIAWGLDRLIAILENEPNIREVIAFPKTGDGRDLMMNAPSEVDKKQLKELNLEIKNKSAGWRKK